VAQKIQTKFACDKSLAKNLVY